MYMLVAYSRWLELTMLEIFEKFESPENATRLKFS
jgi:hypothetical protein